VLIVVAKEQFGPSDSAKLAIDKLKAIAVHEDAGYAAYMAGAEPVPTVFQSVHERLLSAHAHFVEANTVLVRAQTNPPSSIPAQSEERSRLFNWLESVARSPYEVARDEFYGQVKAAGRHLDGITEFQELIRGGR
jgi:hypothetical protein